MEEAMKNSIEWFGIIAGILILFSDSVIITSVVMVCWTILIGIFMIGKIINKGDKIDNTR